MISRYGIFCKVMEVGSFTKVAEQLGYSQSAVSQVIKSLEQELGTTLINRKKDGISLTKDGQQFLPYLQTIHIAEEALKQKQQEMQGLENSTIRIGTFTSVSRNLLPQLMKEFKEQYPHVNFNLIQGEYTSISKWVQEGIVDFGFVNTDAVTGLTVKVLYQDEMLAVLPINHPLTKQNIISLHKLESEPFILLDEGEHSVPMDAFSRLNLSPKIEYKVYDDYSILAMVRQSLGVSIMYKLVLTGFKDGLEIRPIKEKLKRTVGLAWRNWEVMPLAARRFSKFILEHTPDILSLLSNEEN